MYYLSKPTILSFLACLLIFSACDDDMNDNNPDCKGLYDQEVVLPGAEPLTPSQVYGEGTYTAIPETISSSGDTSPALTINPETGVIDVKQSASGIEYYITFTSKDGSFVCEDSITISGIDYLDTKIDAPNLDQIDDEVNIVFPIVDADPDQNAPRGDYDIGGDGRGQGLAIDVETGAINALQTLRNIRDTGNLEEGIPYEFTFEYSYGNVVSSQTILIYWFEEEYSDEFNRLFEEKSQFPRNGRIMSPPPMVGVKSKNI